MAAPNTGGQLRTKIADMQVGDYIYCNYWITTSGQVGYFEKFGTQSVTSDTYAGVVNGNSSFAFVKVDKGLLVADRVLQHSISWDVLNTAEFIQGKNQTFDGKTGIIRSLGGGNSYASATGTSQTTDAGLGAWPVDNEWDQFIVKKDYGTGAGRDDVWHWNGISSWCQETFSGVSANRVRRGYTNGKTVTSTPSSNSSAAYGFRPVFEYQEVAP